MNINKNNYLNIQNLSFTGHRVTQDKCGNREHKFYYLYDPKKYTCKVELFNITKDEKGNFDVPNKETPVLDFDMVDGGITKNLSELKNVNPEHGFAYRFKLTDRSNPNNVSYGFDNGTVIGIFETKEGLVEKKRKAEGLINQKEFVDAKLEKMGLKGKEEFVAAKLKKNGLKDRIEFINTKLKAAEINEEDYKGSEDSEKELNEIKEKFGKEFDQIVENFGEEFDQIEKKFKDEFDNTLKSKYDSEMEKFGKQAENEIRTSSNKFNVVLPNRAVINKNGPMQLIMPDEYYPYPVDPALVLQVMNSGNEENQKNEKYIENKEAVDGRIKAKNTVRNHANKLGGKFAGIIYRLPEISKEGIKRIVGTPFTKDTISSHLYWTENAFQVAPTLGTENDFKQLQVELFKNDINWIADAALVNQGLGGVHFSEVLRKGDDATTKNMFRTQEKISLGIIPNEETRETIKAKVAGEEASKKNFTRMKMINAPFVISSNGEEISENKSYDSKKPTYIQFYDDRLASEKQKESQSPKELSTYDIKNTENIYDITRHDDAVYPFAIEVSPKELEYNVRRELKHQGKINSTSRYANTLSDVKSMMRIANFGNFRVGIKEKAAGVELWDGNVDIPKLNFFRSASDDSLFADLLSSDVDDKIEAFERGTFAARDYAVSSGKYWTQLTADAQLQYASKKLSEKRRELANGNEKSVDYYNVIQELAKEGKLPKSVKDKEIIDNSVIENVKNGEYNLSRLKSDDVHLHDYITRKVMDMPLETLPVATNLLGVLTNPYIAKKANSEDEIGVSRYDLSSIGNPNLPDKYRKTYERMDDIYNEIANRIYMLASQIDGVRDENANITDYGRYVIAELAPDLTKYMLIKSLNADAEVEVDDDGNFDFSKVDEEKITMQSIGIPYNGMSADEEAKVALKTIKCGLSNLNTEELQKKIVKRFENRSLDDFRMAEMILDRTESGLGWRIDAAKDVGAIDGIRAGVNEFDDVWDQVIGFWKTYTQAVLSVNPHAYTTAEITNVPDFFPDGAKYNQLSDEEKDARKYKSAGDAERKFLEETGITSVANYNYFFSHMPELFAPNSFEHGGKHGNIEKEENGALLGKLDDGWEHGDYNNPGLLFNSPADGVENSYTFFGNHDKPRPLHGLVLNTNLFNFDFKKLDENSVHAAIDAVKKGIPEWAWKRVFVGNDGGDALPEKFVKEGKEFLEKLEKDGTGNSIKENINLIIDCIEKVGKEYFESIGKKEGKDYLVSSAPGWRKDSLGSLEYYEIAADVLQITKIVDEKEVLKNIDEISFDDVNAMAVAMGQRLNEAFAKVLENNPNLNVETKKSVATLASGEHKGSKFDPTAFGTRPFDIAIKTVLDETEHRTGKKIKDRKNIEIEVLKNLLVPAYDRYLSMYKLLSTLPGSPTDFAGDRVGASGYESKAKNYHQQNRNTINWEWLEDDDYSFIKDSYDEVNKIAVLRSRPELSALNDGATITAPLVALPVLDPKTHEIVKIDIKDKDGNTVKDDKYADSQVQSMIRYNNKGSVVVSFHDITGASTPLNKKMNRGRKISNADKRLYFENVENNVKRGLKFGLEEGMILKNALDLNEADSPYYKVGCDEYTDKDGSTKCKYYVEKFDGTTKEKQDINIEPRDYNTLLLCKPMPDNGNVDVASVNTTVQNASAVNKSIQKNDGLKDSVSVANAVAQKAYTERAQSTTSMDKIKVDKTKYADKFVKVNNDSDTKVHKEMKLITKLFHTIISIFVSLFTLGKK